MKLQCKHCGYNTNKEEVPKRCPYCGEEGTMMLSKNAQDIIDSL